MNATWQALAREAGLAAEHLAIGVTALGRANYAQHAYYGQAFFALTIGLERSSKLALVVDYALENKGKFPSNKELRAYGHNLRELLERADQIAARRGLSSPKYRMPQSIIHTSIVKVLSDFATNITRYYNLDFVTGQPNAARIIDPVASWFQSVTQPILDKHYKEHHRLKHEYNARLIHQILSPFSLIRFHDEKGEELNTPFDASKQTAITDFAKPYTRMYVMQIIRFLARLLSELGYASYGKRLGIIPQFSEFFGIFNNSDKYFKERKTWSIYRP